MRMECFGCVGEGEYNLFLIQDFLFGGRKRIHFLVLCGGEFLFCRVYERLSGSYFRERNPIRVGFLKRG